MSDPKWLGWARRLQAIAQSGLTYAKDPYDTERYQQIRQLAAEIAAEHTDAPAERILGLFSQDSGYATPKVDVRGVVVRDGAILLVKERQDGLWTLPGGWADIGESPSEAVAREVREESGFRARPVRLLAVYDRSRHGHGPHPAYIYKLFFLCQLEGGEASASLETDGAAFFRQDELPDLSTGRTTAAEIGRMLELAGCPEAPTDFD